MHQDPHDQSASSRFLKLGFTFVAVSVACPVSGQADLVINEVFYRSSEAQLEYVELLNIASSAVDLNDYLFSDDRLKPVELVDHSRRIEPGGMVVLTRNAEIFDANFSFSDRIQIPSWPVLNNGATRS